MSRSTDPIAHWKDLENWLSAVTGSLLPQATDNLRQHTQEQLDTIITDLMAQDPLQSFNHKELAKITGSLSHTLIATLKLNDTHAAHLQEELTLARQRINQLELETQDQQERSNEMEISTKREIKKLQETLITTTRKLEQANSAQDDLANKLQYAEQILEKAKVDLRDKNSQIKALETHLEKSQDEISSLNLQLDYVKEESESIKEELKHAYELHPESTRTRRPLISPLPSRAASPIQGLPPDKRSEATPLKHSPTLSEEHHLADRRKGNIQREYEVACGLTLKDLDKLAGNINKFTPNVSGSQDVQAYLQDIDFHLEMRANVTDRDKLYLLRSMSSPEVRSFLDRQPTHTKSDYHLLREALIKEFSDPESDQGLVAALETKQGRHESPQVYYNRLRRADMEEDLNFKTLFLRNLHPGVSHHLGIMACPRSMTIQQLRDLAHKAFGKQKMASGKGTKPPEVFDVNTQNHELALEGTQHHDSTIPPPKERRESSFSKEWDSHVSVRPKQLNNHGYRPREQPHASGRHWENSWNGPWSQENRWDNSWNQQLSYRNSRGKGSWQTNRMSKGNRQPTPRATSPRNLQRNSHHSWHQSDQLNHGSTQEQKTEPGMSSQELMQMFMREFFKRNEEDRKWEKKNKSDSA